MKILVIGSEGNVGKRIVPYFTAKGYTVYCADQVQALRDNYFVANILSSGDISRIFEKVRPDIVYLLAAMVSRLTCEQSSGLTVDTNITGTNNIIQLCKQYGSKLIYFSTSEVYGNIGGLLSEDRQCKPNNLYGLTKYLAEQLIEYEITNGLKAIIVRPFMFYDEQETLGEHRSAIIRFAEKLIRKERITVYKNSFRSWMHTSDAMPILDKINNIGDFDIINLGTNQLVLTQSIANRMCEYLELDYFDYVTEADLPAKMTLSKNPDITKQIKLSDLPLISIYNGIARVLNTVKERLRHE